MCRYCESNKDVKVVFDDDGIGVNGNPIRIPRFNMNMFVYRGGLEFALRDTGNYNEWISDADIKYCPFCGKLL